jgi:ABC-type Fe3+ transport system permease subunit/sugar lactone lactonase YvrE
VERLATWTGFLIWTAVVVLPIATLYGAIRWSDLPEAGELSLERYGMLLGRSVVLASVLATLSLLAGWPAGRLIGAKNWARTYGPLLLMMCLIIPPQVTFYAWGLLFLPNSWLGMRLSQSDFLIETTNLLRSVFSLGLWYWPICSLMMGLAWRRTDGDVWAQAKLDAGTMTRWWRVGLPMLGKTLMTVWLAIFTLAMSQFAVFHLAGVDTLGTELAVVYQMTGNVRTVAWAAIPLVIPAVWAAWSIQKLLVNSEQSYDLRYDEPVWRGYWFLAGGLWGLSCIVPIVLLVMNLESFQRVTEFASLGWRGLASSGMIGIGAAVLAIVIASAISLQGRFGSSRLAGLMRWMCFVAAMLPGALVAVAMVYAFNRGVLTMAIYNQPWMVSIGHGAQLAVLAVVMFAWVQNSQPREISELAKMDGAGGIRGLIHVWLPGMWPALAGAGLLAVTLSMTELAATLVLLPAGVPNFAQELLNQMHYAREQQVVVSSLLLIFVGIGVSLTVAGLCRLAGGRKLLMILMLGFAGMAGCDKTVDHSQKPVVETVFGETGRGEGQFIYPRAITIADDESIFVVDKTARVQHMTAEGQFLNEWTMPEFKTGKPVGLFNSKDGKIFVADTHYHRVMIYSPDGKLEWKFGSYGKGPREFIYPTDVDVAPDGRIFVSEYGGNDRISIFSSEGDFIKTIGSFGEGENQFSRPSAICIDAKRKVLYVADACNHRIVLYDLDGRYLGKFGSAGREAGQLSYPYDINLLPDGSLVVCEYGNNRIQRLSPDGRSLGIWGNGGREAGELMYPWGVVVRKDGRIVIVDSGNNRIQVWRIL